MKVAILSDLHLGFGSGERGGESFCNAEKAFALALGEKPDAVLVAGDIFDAMVPKQEVLLGAFGVFRYAADGMNAAGELKGSRAAILRTWRGGEEEMLSLPAIIAIHGTHEFRGRDYANVLQLLEKAGFLVYLHAQKIKLAVPGRDHALVVQGMGGVPEKKALDALKALSPKPEHGASNIFLMHQSIKEFLPVEDEMVATIGIPDLPQGFDLVVNGHLHWRSEEKLHCGGKLLMPGSTIITQMKKLESGKEKGVTIFDTESRTLRFLPLPGQRRFFYHRVDFEMASAKEVMEKAAALVDADLESMKKPAAQPLVRLKLTGTLAVGVSPSDVQLNEIEGRFRGRAILSIGREFSAADFRRKIAELREMQQSKKSVISMGMEMLEKNLEEAHFNSAFDAARVFELLAEGETEKVIKILAEPKPKK